MTGAAAIRQKEPSLRILIHEHESLGNFRDALACYESMGKNETQTDSAWQSGAVRCYLACDQPHTAAMLVRGMAEARPELEHELKKYQLEAAWQLGQWDAMDDPQGVALDDDFRAEWEPSLATLLKCLHTEDRKSFMRHLESATAALMKPISAAALEEGAFERSYDHVVKLQGRGITGLQLSEVQSAEMPIP